MKRVLLFAALAVFGLSVNAQEEEQKSFGFEQGNILVEGMLSFGSSTSDDGDFEETNSNFSFMPKAGYFVSDKLAVGIELEIGSGKMEIDGPSGSSEDKMSSFAGGAFARYYFLPLGNRFQTYAEAGVGFGSQTTEFEGIDDDEEISSFGIGVDLGINYFVTECFAINFGLTDVLSYSSWTTEFGESEVDNSSFNGSFNMFNNFFSTAKFGLTWVF